LRKGMYGPAEVASVEIGSPAERAGVRAGDLILEVDGEPMRDMVDYYLLLADNVRHRFFVERDGRRFDADIDTGGRDPGLSIREPVFGRLLLCDNNCTFCFVDQLPAGLRDSVYVKDDDYRLSFLQGNFITLTNLEAEDLERILDDRLSPLYVSLHSTDPELRESIFRSRGAARALDNLTALLEGGIEVHVQLVLMRGVNDAERLERTLDDLAGAYRGVSSVGVVPVGISRGGLVEPPAGWGFDRESSLHVLEDLERWRSVFGDAGPFASDEFFFSAGLEAPEADYYCGFPQTENGIGLARIFRDWFTESSWRKCIPDNLSGGTALVTTPIGAWALAGLGLEETGVGLIVCTNSLFGPGVNVCGLLPGKDVGQALGVAAGVERALLPEVAVDGSGAFIDGVSVSEVSGMSGVRVEVVPVNGAALVEAIWRSA
jgi:putative radical SAM enzyme (TIGR03279 family)